MGAVLACLAQITYGCSLVVNMLWTTALMNLVHCVPGKTLQWKEGACLMLTQLGWRIALWCAPWVTCRADADYANQWRAIVELMEASDAEDIRQGNPRRPLFVLGNHTSFFDTIIGVTQMPSKALWRCRTYMSAHLFDLPVLATVCRSVGHFPVHFSSGEDGKFKVDAAKMSGVEGRVDAHIAGGGWLCFFPEGQMNKSPDTVLPFRYGGMKRALNCDARLVSMVFRGNPQVWPRKSTIGGFPGQVRYSLNLVAPDGARAFVAAARADAAPDEKGLEDHVILASRAHGVMQRQYDSLASPVVLGGSAVDGGLKTEILSDGGDDETSPLSRCQP